jgi:hypothetical protein
MNLEYAKKRRRLNEMSGLEKVSIANYYLWHEQRR